MKKLNVRGFSAVEALLILVVLGLIGGAGYYVYQSKNKTSESINTAPTQNTTEEKPKLSEYKSDELGLALSYPSEWGDATLVDGPLLKFQSGKYKQLNFSKATNVSVNFVIGEYSSPLDACGLDDPVQDAQHSQNYKQASVIGWEGDTVKTYVQGQVDDGPSVYPVNKTPGDTGPGWVEVTKKDKVLVYKDIDKPENRVKAGDGDGCSPITQAQADEANAFVKFYHYAANYSNSKVFGVNAQFDARKGDDATVRDQLVDALNSLKNN